MLENIYWNLVEQAEIPSDDPKSFLSPSELQRLATFRFPRRRDAWVIGRWTIKSLVRSLPEFRNLSLAEIEILNNPSGAPYLRLPQVTNSGVSISVSHRDRLGLGAVTLDPVLKLGADLEKVEKRQDGFMEDYFTSNERELVRSCPAEKKERATTLIWSLKEAVLKGLQVGLRMDTRQVEIQEINGLSAPPEEQHKWRDAVIGGPQVSIGRWMAWWRQSGDYVLTIAAQVTNPRDTPQIRLIRNKNPDKGIISGSIDSF